MPVCRSRAETVASQTYKRVKEFVDSGAAVDPFLADQLVVPLALAGGTSIHTQRLSKHAETCLKVLTAFTGQRARIEHTDGRTVRIVVPSAKE